MDEVRIILRKKLKMYFCKPYPNDYRKPNNAEEILSKRLEETFKDLKEKGIKEEEISIGFKDEASPQTTANTVRVWSFKKNVRIVKNTTKMKSNTIGFYAIIGNSLSMPLNSSKAEEMKKFLKEIKEKNKTYKAIIVILDNFSSHLAIQKEAKDVGIYLVFLPKYSPELNPIEFIWKSIKRIVSLTFVNMADELREIIENSFKNLSQQLSFAKSWINKFSKYFFKEDIKTEPIPLYNQIFLGSPYNAIEMEKKL